MNSNESNYIFMQVQPNRATAKKITLDIDGSGPLRPFEVDCRFTTDEQVRRGEIIYRILLM